MHNRKLSQAKAQVNQWHGQESTGSKTPSAANRGTVSPRTVETSFRTFPDGTLVELVRSSETAQELQLLIWRGGQAEVSSSLERDGTKLVPPRISRRLARAVRFPSAVASYGDLWGLFTDIAAAATPYVKLHLHDLQLVAAYVLSTWLVDRFARAAYLSVVGPLGSGKTQLLQFLSCCCRRPLLLTEVSPAGLYSLTDQLEPTLLIDEVEFGRDSRSRELQRLLRGGHTAGGSIFRGGRIYSLYGSKVICSRQPIRDAALASRSVQIAMARSDERVLPLGPAQLRRLAELLQPRLLEFRLRNYYTKLEVRADIKGLSPRGRDLVLSLAGPLVEKPDLQEAIVRLLRQREHDLQAHHADEPEMLVLEALFHCCHAIPTSFVTAGNVSLILNKLLVSRGELRSFQPRAVGPILRGLGFSTERLSGGIGIWLTSQARSHLHELMGVYRMPIPLLPSVAICPECNKLLELRKAPGSSTH